MTFVVEILMGAEACQAFIDRALGYINEGLQKSFLGLDEGTVNDPNSTEFDVGEASQNRDWVSDQKTERRLHFYFSDKKSATIFCNFTELSSANVKEVKNEDWNKSWKDSFEGLDLEPDWAIRPSWSRLVVKPGKRIIYLDPSFGFGFGNHPTTRMCLQILGSIHLPNESRVLDFGSGSGILSVAAGLLGAKEVLAVEIDDPAREASQSCFELNKMESKIRAVKAWRRDTSKFQLVFANIISRVLEEHQSTLVGALDSSAQLILSGVLSSEGDELKNSYEAALSRANFKILDFRELEDDSWKSYYFKVESLS